MMKRKKKESVQVLLRKEVLRVEKMVVIRVMVRPVTPAGEAVAGVAQDLEVEVTMKKDLAIQALGLALVHDHDQGPSLNQDPDHDLNLAPGHDLLLDHVLAQDQDQVPKAQNAVIRVAVQVLKVKEVQVKVLQEVRKVVRVVLLGVREVQLEVRLVVLRGVQEVPHEALRKVGLGVEVDQEVEVAAIVVQAVAVVVIAISFNLAKYIVYFVFIYETDQIEASLLDHQL